MLRVHKDFENKYGCFGKLKQNGIAGCVSHHTELQSVPCHFPERKNEYRKMVPARLQKCTYVEYHAEGASSEYSRN